MPFVPQFDVYKPADILRWLKIGSQSLRSVDLKPVKRDEISLKGVVGAALGKALDIGKATVASAGGWAIDRLEYRFHEDRLEMLGAGLPKSILYSEIRSVTSSKRTFQVVYEGGKLTLRPYAWLLVSGVKVPLGWERNGMEVSFELLAEELAARAKLEVLPSYRRRALA
ncbi:MAG: hypothetical protein H0W86_03430 [Armatimonadetes bacterium]|nr:hypothetical protein [Armatimonadota bacterium]